MLRSVPRPKWTPQTEEQRRAIAAVLRAKKHADEAEGKMWDAVAEAINTGVPAAYMADTVEKSRATLYRHVDRSAATPEEADTDQAESEPTTEQPNSEQPHNDCGPVPRSRTGPQCELLDASGGKRDD